MKLHLLAAVAVLAAPSPVAAFQIETAVTTGCHERITLAGLQVAGWPDGRDAPAPSEYERRILDDAPFAGAADPWTLALLVGVRHNDIEGESPRDLAALALIHNDPGKQPAHCLRMEDHDGASGDHAALVACRVFILSELEAALGDGEAIDLEATVPVEVSLRFRGDVELETRRFPFHLGRALHALQDSFSHSFRNPEDARVRHVLNWIEGNLDDASEPARDGHPHMDVLDDCDAGVAAVRLRERAATDASAALIAAIADPSGGRAGRLERAGAVLDVHLAREPGCSADNGWCGAAEPGLGAGCSAGRAGAAGLVAIIVALLLLAPGRRRTAVLVLALTATLAPRAVAQPTRVAAEESGEDLDAADRQLDSEERVLDSLPDPVTRTWGLSLHAGAAFDRAAGAVGVGGRWNGWDRVGLGLDLEFNPWFSLSSFTAAPGTVNAYVPMAIRLRQFGSWELRTTVGVGASLLLFDMVGVDSGAVGPYVSWNPLGLAIPVRGDLKLIIEPGDISVPIPQLRGIPFYYHQYRATIALEWYPR